MMESATAMVVGMVQIGKKVEVEVIGGLCARFAFRCALRGIAEAETRLQAADELARFVDGARSPNQQASYLLALACALDEKAGRSAEGVVEAAKPWLRFFLKGVESVEPYEHQDGVQEGANRQREADERALRTGQPVNPSGRV
jgi:hypothetical protein